MTTPYRSLPRTSRLEQVGQIKLTTLRKKRRQLTSVFGLCSSVKVLLSPQDSQLPLFLPQYKGSISRTKCDGQCILSGFTMLLFDMHVESCTLMFGFQYVPKVLLYNGRLLSPASLVLGSE